MANSRMSQSEKDAIAQDINAVTAALSKVPELKTASPQGCAMALVLAAAAHVLHSGGTTDDYMNLVSAAWVQAQKRHGVGG